MGGASPTGDGVLKRFRGEEANNYIKDYIVNYDANAFEILDIRKEEEGKIIDHFDQLLQSSEKLPDNPDGKYYNDPDARIIDKYDWTEGNNCTSKACGGINVTKSKLFTYHITRTNGAGDILYDQDKKYSFVKPSFLESHLRFKSNEKNPIVNEITEDLKLKFE